MGGEKKEKPVYEMTREELIFDRAYFKAKWNAFEKIRPQLEKIAAQKVEDLEEAISGGNYDDAYWGGYTGGEVSVATMVLEVIKEVPSGD